MKKIIALLLAISLFIPFIGSFKVVDIDAESNNYKVAWIKDDGSFDVKDTYSNFSDAVNRMEELGGDNGDYVVLSDNSLSPMKIVAMNAGIVYAYPYRNSSKVLSIYAELNSSKLSPNSSRAKTYVAANNIMTYIKTAYHYAAGEHGVNYDHGYIKVNLRGFVGYTDLEYCDLVPMKFIEKGISVTLGGNASGQYQISKSAFAIKLELNRYYVATNGKYKDLCLEQNYVYGNKLGQEIDHIGVAPEFMEEGNGSKIYYYSEDGVNFYKDRYLSDYVGTYYNYYLFVPARTYTKISADTINKYIKLGSGGSSAILNKGQDFIDSQNEFGFNGALACAIGIHESGWGKNLIATNNIFGIAAYDDNLGAANSFNSIGDCIDSLMGDVLANYLDVDCSWYYSMSLGTKEAGFITSYASDPYWGEQIAQFYYGMDKLDNNANGNLTDYNSIDLALVKENAQVKRSASSSSETLYSTINKFGYQRNLIVPVLGVENGFAKTRTSCPIDNGEVMHAISLSKGNLLSYDKDQSIGYIDVNKLIPLNFEMPNTEEEPEIDEDKLSLSSYIRNISLDDNKFYIEGIAVIKGIDFTNINDIKHELIFSDYNNPDNSITVLCDTSEAIYDVNDGKTYKYVKFSKTLSLQDIPAASYALRIKVTNKTYSKESYLLCAESEFSNMSTFIDDTNYHLSCNQLYSYRIELDVEKVDKSEIDYSTINKMSMRKSLLSFDKIELKDDDKASIEIKGHGFIYYLDYSDDASPSYQVYLLGEDGATYKLNTELRESPTDYAKVLGSSYNLKNICFTASGNVDELLGDYKIVVKMSNTINDETYIDYMELTNPDEYEFDSISKDSKTYEINTQKARNRLVLSIKES